MESKKFEAILFENILVAGNEIPWLSPLWNLIYEEGVKSNHLLFSLNDALSFSQKFQNYDTKTLNAKIAKDSQLECLLYQLLCCSHLGEMIKIIDKEDDKTKFHLFAFYLRVLEIIKNKLKLNLN